MIPSRASSPFLCALVILFLCMTGAAAASPVPLGGAPTIVSYQGQVRIAGEPFTGAGYFKFAIVDGAGTTSSWSNDGTSSGGDEPTAAVTLTVASGLFSVLLGDTTLAGMTEALEPAVFGDADRYLRVWFSPDAGGPFTMLAPDMRIAAVPYALNAAVAGNADTVDGLDAGAFWQLGGNAGTAAGDFLGTTDGQALELRAGAARLRLEPLALGASIVAGHESNSLTAGVLGATISGGSSAHPNRVTDDYGTIGGGAGNRAGDDEGLPHDRPYATVGGGYNNIAGYEYATVGGGQNNVVTGASGTVGGGMGNQAVGRASTVAGGLANEAVGSYSFAAGGNARAMHTGSFVWSDWGNPDDPVGTPFSSARANHFAVRARGGFYFVTSGDLSSGVELMPGGGSWNTFSDRAAKENLAPVDQQALLAGLAEIPVGTWNYKAQDPSIRHIGPMAQDFNALLPDLGGEGEKYINSADADGVALAAIQGLYQRSEDQTEQIEQLQAENAALRELIANAEAENVTLREMIEGIEARLSALE